MVKSLKERWAEALEDAQRKADELGEDEINARLGPATQRFFEAAEKMDGSYQRLFHGVGGPVLATLGMGLAGWVAGSVVLSHALPFAAVTALTGLLFLSVFWITATARKNGGDIPYLAGMAGFLACSAAGTGTEDSAIVGLVFLAGVGLAQICVRRAPKGTDHAPPSQAADEPQPETLGGTVFTNSDQAAQDTPTPRP
jgi:branched-subunit amino acid transport protein